MSSPTWTPAALRSELRPYEQRVWRVVEAQHHFSTRKIVDTATEQNLLEDLIEKAKPPVPIECRGLDWLLSTPFRYDAPYPIGSRFRRAGRTAGVFYAAETPETAVAEMAFHRLLFFAEFALDAVARQSGGIHRLLGRRQDGAFTRSDEAATRRLKGALASSDGI